MVLRLVDFVKNLINPDRQREARLVERVEFEAFGNAFHILGVLLFLAFLLVPVPFAAGLER